jgi:hypothetical protein
VLDFLAVTHRLTSEQSGGSICIFESAFDPGTGNALHVHSREDEIAYVLEGALEVRLRDRIAILEAGSWVRRSRWRDTRAALTSAAFTLSGTSHGRRSVGPTRSGGRQLGARSGQEGAHVGSLREELLQLESEPVDGAWPCPASRPVEELGQPLRGRRVAVPEQIDAILLADR